MIILSIIYLWISSGNQSADPSMAKDQNARAKSESRHERLEGAMKPDVQQKKSSVSANGSDNQIPSSAVQGKSSGVVRVADEPPKPVSDEGVKVSAKPSSESEVSPRVYILLICIGHHILLYFVEKEQKHTRMLSKHH